MMTVLYYSPVDPAAKFGVPPTKRILAMADRDTTSPPSYEKKQADWCTRDIDEHARRAMQVL